MKSLTRENFWDEVEVKQPKAFNDFADWIDAYKKKVEWDKIFQKTAKPDKSRMETLKFHDLPIAIQMGIIIEYFLEVADLDICGIDVETPNDLAKIVRMFFEANEKRIKGQ